MLSRTDSADPKWYPVAIHKIDELLSKVIYSGRGYRHTYALRRNIAYNLQYIEYLDRTVQDLKLSEVLVTQTWKTLVITGSGVVECLLNYLLIARGLQAKSEWELVVVAPGNQKIMEGESRKVDSYIYRKRPSPTNSQMTFDAMLKKAKSKKILGTAPNLYSDLDRLRPLRNRVHLQQISSDFDTDYNAFNWNDAVTMARVLKEIFTSNIFRPSAAEIAYFDYLERYVAT